MRRVLAITAALGMAACGSSTDAPADTRVYAHDVPKPNYPRSQDTPESFAVPTTTTKRRASRSKPRTSPQPAREVETPTPAGDVWHALAMCESGMRQNATSPNGLYLSYFQWSLPTWRSVGGAGDPRTVPYETQVELAKRLQARSGWSQWPACSRKLGLR